MGLTWGPWTGPHFGPGPWTTYMDKVHEPPPVMDRAYLIWVVVAFKEGCTHPSQGLSEQPNLPNKTRTIRGCFHSFTNFFLEQAFEGGLGRLRRSQITPTSFRFFFLQGEGRVEDK